jgi:hypothetical protein
VGCFAGCRRIEAVGKAIAAGADLALARCEGDAAPACRRVVVAAARTSGYARGHIDVCS